MKMNTEDLASALLSAAENPAYWEMALALLAQECGALAAIITLRSSVNAQIVISTEMESEFHTPYVGGFPHEMVKIYVEQFRSNDPWSKVQSYIHPHLPILMSDHLPIGDFEKTDFGRWVTKDVFNDTVVVEIGCTKNHWTALNLYFMNRDGAEAGKIVERLRERLDDVKRAWSLGRTVQQSFGVEKQLLAHVKDHPEALVLVDAEGRMVTFSQQAENLIEQGIARICSRTGKLEVSSDTKWKGECHPRVLVFESDEESRRGYSISIDRGGIDSLSTGEEIGLSAITFTHWRNQDVVPWKQECLTEREKLMVFTIAKTNRIQAAAEKLKIGERRNRQIWNNVREKLDGITKSEIVAIYQERYGQ